MPPENQPSQLEFFRIALSLAERAGRKGEVPIGAVLIKDGKIISRAANATEKKGNFFAHAEMLCIAKANRKLKSKYLTGCELYVTLEPCLMCQYAARFSRIEKIHYLLSSEKFGSAGSAYPKVAMNLSVNCNLTPMAKLLLQDFF